MKKYLIITLLALISCSSNEDSHEIKDITIVTGIKLINDFGLEIGRLGNPNGLFYKKEKDQNDPSKYVKNKIVTMYPIPAVNIFKLASQKNILKVWVLKGQSTNVFKNVVFEDYLTNDLYTASEVINKAIEEIKPTKLTNSLTINASKFESGLYRVFVELEGGEIYWENTYIGDYNNDFESINYWK
ncbi:MULTISPECIES: hypothetical protein [unclassified Tenacibaculum]|uniref:hypothetical protein n=1 Tax=unclassified Tenacibaculum TaxID=2635139 RepID=UPI001F229432|nr:MULTISPECIES: hypothetical protein [unclassified Tenacibaculum]MCF2873536.1 hypothetical protein [Tenacibaculum sp. Cn5-1]MCF2933692.1 hypothetical protein [Tenacibaculum sp. Cn5-34]MCG7509726.1 hypothetical protein [Tenacibaculum sp. Cn5-46]